MKIKYYGFNNEYISEDDFNINTQLPERIYGFEIYANEENLVCSCFQGALVNALEILESNSSLHRAMKQMDWYDLYHYVDVCSKQNGTLEFLVNMRVNEGKTEYAFKEIKRDTISYTTKEQLKDIFNAIKNVVYTEKTDYIYEVKRTLERK